MTSQGRHPERLIYDKAADSQKLRDRLADQGIDLICPHREFKNRKHTTQDGRKLRRYKRRWIVERSIAWLHNFRRVVTRWEYHDVSLPEFCKNGLPVFTTKTVFGLGLVLRFRRRMQLSIEKRPKTCNSKQFTTIGCRLQTVANCCKPLRIAS